MVKPPATSVKPRRSGYVGPAAVIEVTVPDLLVGTDRALKDDQLRLVETNRGQLFAAGDLELVRRKCVAIVGTRDVSDAGRSRARRLARELAMANVVVVSGLAKGVDTAAMSSAIEHGGRVIGVIGTPLAQAYPAENADLQTKVYSEHLLLTPFAEGERVFKSNFPRRNRVMAAISHATVIVEASDTSGTLHQAAECQRLGRWLFILKSVVDDPRLSWPRKFLGASKTEVLHETADLLAVLG